MRRPGFLALGWVVATLLALVLGLQAVHTISTSLTERPTRAALSPGSVKAALASTTTTVASSDAAGDFPESSPDAASTAGGSSTGPGQGTGPSPSAEDEPGAVDSAGPSDPSSSAPPPPAAPVEDRIYQLQGGTVGVRFENGSAELLYATPNPGFTTDSTGSEDHVDIRFRSDDHESRLRAFWQDGPQATIEES